MSKTQIIENSYMMKFIRTGVGDEEKLVRHLKSKNKKSYHFKMFGKYDFL